MEGDQTSSDEWAYNRVYRGHIITLYTCKLYNVIEQCYPNIFNFKNTITAKKGKMGCQLKKLNED